MSSETSIVLTASGKRAEIEPDRWRPGSFQLVVDGTPQSHVNPEDPTQLYFEYVERIGHVIDQIGMPGQPLTAVHLGAGAMTIPRYIEATRPGSRQQVIELERDLIALVRAHLPLPPRASIRIRYGDAREVLGRLPAGLNGTADLLVADIFSGAQTPAHVTTVEFYRMAAAILKPDGILVVNVADAPGLAFARGQAATLSAVFQNVAILAEAQVLKGRRFGNLVMVASQSSLPIDWLPRLLAGGPHPARSIAGRELIDFIAGARVVTDDTALPSPAPSRGIFGPRS